MIKNSLHVKRKWKRSYHILTAVMVIFACLLITMEIQLTDTRSQDAIPVFVKRSAGKPKKETIGTVYQLESNRSTKQGNQTSVQNKKKAVATKTNYQKPISKKEYAILTRIVEAETTGGDIKSKQIVANVILNRVEASGFPNTIEEVVFQKTGSIFQFSPILDGRYYSVTVTKETKKAVEQALKGKDDSKGALYFANRSYSNPENMAWFDNHLKYLFTYGGHEYFTEWK